MYVSKPPLIHTTIIHTAPYVSEPRCAPLVCAVSLIHATIQVVHTALHISVSCHATPPSIHNTPLIHATIIHAHYPPMHL